MILYDSRVLQACAVGYIMPVSVVGKYMITWQMTSCVADAGATVYVLDKCDSFVVFIAWAVLTSLLPSV